ncbi:nuclear transport factor 2 family protein [Taibaiella lutea]|uniref:Nuclear transport factor 2 family protein n=1 Tax=Taibaiella lutea TaxID=2608001 RepID=A0A5M6CTJ9_9BACT|nr:nuclear transport factor 2 family protein [Taibaiella lutea]KAA5536335.1 nuclear transport factor 2 family protein [Taibaiella lutea]
MKESIAQFFDDYARRFNESLPGGVVDIEKTAACFAASFIESNPNKIICTKNDEAFKASIPHGFEYYRSIGLQSMKICSKAITILDDFHALVKVHWQSLYIKKEGNKMELGFDIHYMVRRENNQIQIFSYTSGDEQEFLEKHGLVPYK